MRAEALIIMNVITMRFFPILQVHLNSVEGFWSDKLELDRALKFEIHPVCQTAQLSMQIQLFKINTIKLQLQYNRITM